MRLFLFRISLLPLLLALIAISTVVYYHHTINTPLNFDDEIFVIQKGETLHSIAERLVDKKIVNEPYTLRIKARLEGISSQIRAGKYRFPNGIIISDLLNRLVNGTGQVGIKVTIIEGWSFKQMRKALAKEERLVQLTVNWTDQQIMEKLGYPELHPEGQFYPDTYHYWSGDTDLSILEKAFMLMQQKLECAWGNRSNELILKDSYEALIMASIIEKETQHRPEQSKIAGVFVNRLKNGMRLQTDPTVIYGLGDKYDGDIKSKHLKTDTPYNTYIRYGLTPTPISLPGMDSLLAAVNPEETDAYYFVAKGGGKHYFSRTLSEHNAAVQKYILSK